jgi:suppressor of tumorigenicity protein 13
MPGGMGGMGGLGGLLNDPELMANLSDPEVAKAFQDIMANPANLMKYQSNPKVMALLQKMTSKMGGGGGMPGMGGGGGRPGMGGGMPGGMGGKSYYNMLSYFFTFILYTFK